MAVELSSEDALRLNVLAAQAQAVRIDEGRMVVHGLAGGQEVRVPLHPNTRAEPYLKAVRELLAGIALDSPGGYPVFLKRWTRMGEMDHERLGQLLRLGEPEAVTAVAGAPGLDDELARRVWWCRPDAEVARRMLERAVVVHGAMGPVLARFLLEFLPFEADPFDMVNSVRLILQPGLLGEEEVERLWNGGKRKAGYRVGFLITRPERLPRRLPARADLEALRTELGPSARTNPLAVELLRLFDGAGQSFLAAAADVAQRLAQADVSSALFDAVGAYPAAVRDALPELRASAPDDVAQLKAAAARLCAAPPAGSALAALLERIPRRLAEVEALLLLGHLEERLLTPILSRTDAVGTVLRRRLEPATTPLLEAIAALRGG